MGAVSEIVVNSTQNAPTVSSSVVLLNPDMDLQAAIDATPEGGILNLGPGTYTAKTPGGFLITKAITIQGSGVPHIFSHLGNPDPTANTSWTRGTIIHVYNATADTDGGLNSCGFRIVAAAGVPLISVTIRDLGIENPYNVDAARVGGAAFTGGVVPFGTGDGIRFDASAYDPDTGGVGYIGYATIENVVIRFMGRDGINFTSNIVHGSVTDQSQIKNVQTAGCRRHGFYASYITDVDFTNCTGSGNEQCNMYLFESYNIGIYHSVFLGSMKSGLAGGDARPIWTGGGRWLALL